MAAVAPAERHVHQQIEHPEALAAFRRPPNNGKPGARDNAFHQIIRAGAELDVIEGGQAKTPGPLRRFITSALRTIGAFLNPGVVHVRGALHDRTPSTRISMLRDSRALASARAPLRPGS